MPLDTRIPLMAQGIQLPDFNAIAAQKQEQAKNAFLIQQMQQQASERQQAMGLRKNIGGMAAAGDYAGARKTALESGDFDMVEAVKGLSAEQKAAAMERNQQMAKLALSVGQLPYEQRQAAIRAAEPFISGLGIDPGMLEQFDPTDENISGIVNSVQSLDQLLKRQDEMNAPYTLGQGDRRYAGGKLLAENPAAPKYLTVPEGGMAYRIDGGNLSPASGGGSGNIPFEALLGIESGGNHFAKGGGPLLSPKGAVGIAQVMPGTAPEAARMAGLPWDEARYRSDPGYNRAIGEAYYNNMRQKYGNDLIAAAAYNAGPGAVDKALRQGGDNWLSALPAETRNYVARLSPQNNMAPNVIKGRPKAPGETFQTLSSQEARKMGLPAGPVYQRSTKTGEVKAVTGSAAASGGNGTRQQQGLAKLKISGLRAIEGQLGRVEQALTELEKDGYTGTFLGHVPGSLDATSNKFDKAIAGLGPLIRALTRVPGEGAMSDYESKLASAVLPSRTDTPEGRREALDAMKELIAQTRAGYQEFLGSPPQVTQQQGGKKPSVSNW